MHSVYILYSKSIDRYYIGESRDPERRLAFHRAGAERFTRRAEDWTMVFRKDVDTADEARAIEARIKRSQSRRSIERWIAGEDNLLRRLGNGA